MHTELEPNAEQKEPESDLEKILARLDEIEELLQVVLSAVRDIPVEDPYY